MLTTLNNSLKNAQKFPKKPGNNDIFSVRSHLAILRTTLYFLAVAAEPNYDCSYGESYWCSNLGIAKKCGAVQHCMDTVWRHTDLTGMKVYITYVGNTLTSIKTISRHERNPCKQI